jgi:hypothetical protein
MSDARYLDQHDPGGARTRAAERQVLEMARPFRTRADVVKRIGDGARPA